MAEKIRKLSNSEIEVLAKIVGEWYQANNSPAQKSIAT